MQQTGYAATKAHFDKTARTFGARAWVRDRAFASRLRAVLCPLPQYHLACDLGCGQGHFSQLLGLDLHRTIGIDISESMVRLGKAAAVGGLQFVQGDAHQLPFCTGSFDLVVLRNLLRHCADVPAALSEVKRITRGGGSAIIAENCVLNKEEKDFLDQVIQISEPSQRPFMTSSVLLALIESLGFIIKKAAVLDQRQITTRKYFADHYALSLAEIERVWAIYSNASDVVRETRELRLRFDGSFVSKAHWCIVLATCHANT
jgi:ubiquinone/menaquinone biosynthesis C-methylase UbiE